jgi:hypothetical protein
MTTYALVTQPERVVLCKAANREFIFPLRACFLDSAVINLYASTDSGIQPLLDMHSFVSVELPPSDGWKEVPSTPQLVEMRSRARLLRTGLIQLCDYVRLARTYYDNSLTLSSQDLALYPDNKEEYLATVIDALQLSEVAAQTQLELDYASTRHQYLRAKYLELKFRNLLLQNVFSEDDHQKWLDSLKQEVWGAGLL